MIFKSALAPLVPDILLSRGTDISIPESARVFWSPCISDLHDPELFTGMSTAVDRILEARTNGERVIIFGDYDVDWVSSTAMLLRYFTNIGIAVSHRIPHRSRDGYGMKPYFFDELSSKSVGLVISVDCGTRDIESIRHAKSLGIDVIVTDHHAVPEIVPKEAIALITPKLPGSQYPFMGLSGSGTAFKLLSAVAARITPVWELEDLLLSYIDFATLGTVADMMPLTGENRSIVKLGLSVMPKSRSPGLRRMIKGKNTASADCIGFQVGPRINAAGRMDHADLALRALICSEESVSEILDELEVLNTQRKGSTAESVESGLEAVRHDTSGVVYRSDTIDHGVIGLVAGRLSERLGKPAICCLAWVPGSEKPREHSEGHLMGWVEDTGSIRIFGSARSPKDYDLTAGLDRIQASVAGGIFISYGGHAQAAGFSIDPQRYEEFLTLWYADIEKYRVLLSLAPESATQSIIGKSWVSDGTLHIEDMTLEFVRELEQIGPFGIGFAKPLFTLAYDILPKFESLGSSGEHIRFIGPARVKINGFGLGKYTREIGLLRANPVELLVEVDRESWQGRESVTLMVRDIRAATESS